MARQGIRRREEKGMAYGRDREEGIEMKRCGGSVVAFGSGPWAGREHWSKKEWPRCWKCGGAMGCPKCTAGVITEVLCTRCVVWCTITAFVHHGPIGNQAIQVTKRKGKLAPGLREYPEAYQRAYRTSEPAYIEELRAMAPKTGKGRAASLGMWEMFKRSGPLAYEQVFIDLLAESEEKEERAKQSGQPAFPAGNATFDKVKIWT